MSEQSVVVHDDHHMRVDRVTDRVREVLIVVANPAVSSNNNWPVGFWGAELTHPYYELTEAGFTVTIASPAGGKVDMDALSDPRDPSRWSADDLVTMGFVNTPELAALLEDYGDRAVGVQIMPWRLEDALRERGANYVNAGLFKAFTVRDGRLITGQQQYSGRKVAQSVIAALGV